MSTIVSWNGGSFTVPDTGEENWGGATKVDGLLVSIATNSLQKSGGLFTLSADVNFGGSAGIVCGYIKSHSANIATTGVLRFANNEGIYFRNAANSADLGFLVNASDQMTFNGVVIGGTIPVNQGGTNITSYTTGDLIYASSGAVLAKLGIGTTSQALIVAGGLPTWGTVPVAGGGTGLTAGTSGGILAYTATGTLASSGALTVSQLIIGGGAGAAPSTLAAGSQYQSLVMGAAIPAYGAVALNQAAAVSGALGATNGGTAQSTYSTGDTLYASAANTLSKLPIGTSSQYKGISGGVPSWRSFNPPTVQTFLSGSGTYNLSYWIHCSSASATVGATYTNNAITFTVMATIASGTDLWVTGSGAPSAGGTLTKSAGTGDATITFQHFTPPIYLHVRMVGGGGGGAGSGTSGGTAAGDGGATTFGSSLLTANGGIKAVFNAANAAGGTATIATPAYGTAIPGATGGGSGGSAASTTIVAGGHGGATPFGGGGGGGTVASGTQAAGKAAPTNSGAGGGGASVALASSVGGAGGGAGGFVDAIIPTPSATYAYAVGAAGTAGGAGASGAAGGAGALGYIEVKEHYQ